MASKELQNQTADCRIGSAFVATCSCSFLACIKQVGPSNVTKVLPFSYTGREKKSGLLSGFDYSLS